MGGGEASAVKNETGVHPDVSDMFFNGTPAEEIVPSKRDEENDHLGYSVEKLKTKATEFIDRLKRIGAQHIPDVHALIKDFHDRH